ncbi:uncharacterized protein LOC144709869 [Wolffia australiana]
MNTLSEVGFREVERGQGRKTKTMRSARLRRKWQSREERWRKVDREFDVVVVPSDGGGCLSGSESDDSDWSISWLEPHAPNFFADAEPPELDPESSFAIVVPCYAAPAATAPPTSLPTSSLVSPKIDRKNKPTVELNLRLLGLILRLDFLADGNLYVEQNLSALRQS